MATGEGTYLATPPSPNKQCCKVTICSVPSNIFFMCQLWLGECFEPTLNMMGRGVLLNKFRQPTKCFVVIICWRMEVDISGYRVYFSPNTRHSNHHVYIRAVALFLTVHAYLAWHALSYNNAHVGVYPRSQRQTLSFSLSRSTKADVLIFTRTFTQTHTCTHLS